MDMQNPVWYNVSMDLHSFDDPQDFNGIAGKPLGWRIRRNQDTMFIYSGTADTKRYASFIFTDHWTGPTPTKPFWSAKLTYSVKRGYKAHKLTCFKTRAAAKRSAYRAYKAYARKLEVEREKRAAGYVPPSQRCPVCEKHRKLKNDYLCSECRFGEA